MHPLEETIDGSFHHSKQQQRRRSSLDNSALSAEESFISLIPDIEDYDTSARKRRYSLNNNENKNTTFLAEILSQRPKKDLDLDLDCHMSNHSKGTSNGRYPSRDANKLDDGTGDTQNTSLIDTLDMSDSSMESSCGTFCDAEEGEPANRAYLRKDLGASCFWDDDFDTGSDDEGEKTARPLVPSNERNERIQAALERVRKSKEKEATTALENSTTEMETSN